MLEAVQLEALAAQAQAQADKTTKQQMFKLQPPQLVTVQAVAVAVGIAVHQQTTQPKTDLRA
jgi:hypothetical protein